MRLVIIDRDGVINEDSPNFIRSPRDLRPIDGSLEAIARLTHAGTKVAIATNQSGLARGHFDMDTLNRIHGLLCSRAATLGGRIELIAFCPHGPDGGCGCRKPAPGLLLSIAQRFGTDLSDVPVIGDSLRDLQAADAAGARPVLVLSGNGAKTAAALSPSAGVPVFPDLRAAADHLLTN